jgi:hypothetical protein
VGGGNGQAAQGLLSNDRLPLVGLYDEAG